MCREGLKAGETLPLRAHQALASYRKPRRGQERERKCDPVYEVQVQAKALSTDDGQVGSPWLFSHLCLEISTSLIVVLL